MCKLFFFFKQKTAYDMRISDWSSDVCSSDLCRQGGAPGVAKPVTGIDVERLQTVMQEFCATVGKRAIEGLVFIDVLGVDGDGVRTRHVLVAGIGRPVAEPVGWCAGGQRDRHITRLNCSHYSAPLMTASA